MDPLETASAGVNVAKDSMALYNSPTWNNAADVMSSVSELANLCPEPYGPMVGAVTGIIGGIFGM